LSNLSLLRYRAPSWKCKISP